MDLNRDFMRSKIGGISRHFLMLFVNFLLVRPETDMEQKDRILTVELCVLFFFLNFKKPPNFLFLVKDWSRVATKCNCKLQSLEFVKNWPN